MSEPVRVEVAVESLIRDLGIVEIGTVFELVETGLLMQLHGPQALLSVTARNYGTTAMGGLIDCSIGGATVFPMSTDPLEPGQSVTRRMMYSLPDLWTDFSPGQPVTVECSVEPTDSQGTSRPESQ